MMKLGYDVFVFSACISFLIVFILSHPNDRFQTCTMPRLFNRSGEI